MSADPNIMLCGSPFFTIQQVLWNLFVYFSSHFYVFFRRRPCVPWPARMKLYGFFLGNCREIIVFLDTNYWRLRDLLRFLWNGLFFFCFFSFFCTISEILNIYRFIEEFLQPQAAKETRTQTTRDTRYMYLEVEQRWRNGVTCTVMTSTSNPVSWLRPSDYIVIRTYKYKMQI